MPYGNKLGVKIHHLKLNARIKKGRKEELLSDKPVYSRKQKDIQKENKE